MTTWVYQETERGLYTVGFYTPDGEWITDSDHGSREDAAKRVHYLNGKIIDRNTAQGKKGDRT